MVATLIVITVLLFSSVNCDEYETVLIRDFTRSAVHAVRENVNILPFREEKLIFLLYNRERPEGYRLIRKDTANLRDSGFDSNYPTKVLIHGYINNYISDSVQLPKDAYLSKGNYNVLVVDWSEYAFPYLLAVKYSRNVGRAISLMVLYLRKEAGLKSSNLHIIGHSLGSHIAGFAAKQIKPKPDRITGLDPAFPVFGDSPPSERLDQDDAKFVDIIHTSSPIIGITQNIGHVDFYPNGGRLQPKCHKQANSWQFWRSEVSEVLSACDHAMAYVYFAESIKNGNRYPAVKCDSLREALEKKCTGRVSAVMGEYAYYGNPRGIYYTNLSERPYRLLPLEREEKNLTF